MKTIVAEKLTLNRSILGWATVPCDASNHPLLSALQGDCPRSEWAHIECRDVADAIAEIKTVAKDMGITVQVCGNIKRNPTIILRSKHAPDQWSEPTSLPPAQKWQLRICSVHATSGYQVTHVRPADAPVWWLAWQAPQGLVDFIALDLETLTLSGWDSSKLAPMYRAKGSTQTIGEHTLTMVDFNDDGMVFEVTLDQPIAAEKTHRAYNQARIDLKWCVFAEHDSTWDDCGYSHVLDMMREMAVGQTLSILASASKECRRGRVHLVRTGEKAWKLNGAVSCDWDDVPDLADTLGVCFEEDVGTDVPEDEDELISFLAEFNAKQRTNYTAISSENVFRESVPMLWDTAEPGTEHEFDRRVRGDVAHLLAVMSKLEDEAMSRDEKIWSDLEGSYRVTSET